MAVIEVSDLKKKYPLYRRKKDKLKEAFSLTHKSWHEDFWALKGISFSVEKGECVGIIGLNGSGKSTLLKILTEIIRPTEGTARTEGKVAALLELGSGFNPDYTGMENIYLNTMMLGMSRQETEEKLQDILDFADIGDFINQPVRLYSSGMFVRLAFAIAVCAEPDILIVDEALSVGDVFFQQKCYMRMRQLIEHSTVLLVTHDMNAVTKFCTRCIVLNQGEIIFDGTTREAVTAYFKIRQGQVMEKPEAGPSSEGDELFRKPDDAQLSGDMGARIEAYYYDVEGAPFAENCAKDQRIRIALKIRAERPVAQLITGFQIRDQYGNEVFGETSMTSGYGALSVPDGVSYIRYSFVWPEIREGAYTITLGIGEGPEVLNQVELCWINQAIRLNNTTFGKLIYGLFNQPMENLTVTG